MTINMLNRLQSKPTHVLVSWVFLRGLALIYLAAFASMAGQIEGLIGENGILPIKSELAAVTQNFPDSKFTVFPTVFWFDASDQTLLMVCAGGMICAALLLFNLVDRIALLLCFTLYLSISTAGQDFTAFQWDALLLEAGFLGLFLSWGSTISVFLYQWLIARFMFMGGLVKLASGDTSWTHLTALNYHYQTQPLPSPVAYYAYHLPQWVNELSVVAVLTIELIFPFFIVLPRRFRLFAAWSFILLQSGIMLTGNYNFFNLLTILLCLFLFDDQAIEKILPTPLIYSIRQKQPLAGNAANSIAAGWLGIVLVTCAIHVWLYNIKQPLILPLKALVQLTTSYSLINNYGPFAIMTTERPEIIVQGSNDGKNWLTYHFKYKPVNLDQKLIWLIPHQPRLDWQMWFAAMEKPTTHAWFAKFMQKLQKGSHQVLSLMDENPFRGKPPAHVRALLYRYTYTSPKQRASTGKIWRREYVGLYWPPKG
ncbi:MAG: lipase maturation factor family protein [Methylococcaceae bacterium]|nr:lipase maturation factor family protein [Methylococcaceae bacterium]